MDRHPSELSVEELDIHYGKAVQMPIISATLATMSNDNHNIVSFEVVTEKEERWLLRFTQGALSELIKLADDWAGQTERPSVN